MSSFGTTGGYQPVEQTDPRWAAVVDPAWQRRFEEELRERLEEAARGTIQAQMKLDDLQKASAEKELMGRYEQLFTSGLVQLSFEYWKRGLVHEAWQNAYAAWSYEAEYRIVQGAHRDVGRNPDAVRDRINREIQLLAAKYSACIELGGVRGKGGTQKIQEDLARHEKALERLQSVMSMLLI